MWVVTGGHGGHGGTRVASHPCHDYDYDYDYDYDDNNDDEAVEVTQLTNG